MQPRHPPNKIHITDSQGAPFCGTDKKLREPFTIDWAFNRFCRQCFEAYWLTDAPNINFMADYEYEPSAECAADCCSPAASAAELQQL